MYENDELTFAIGCANIYKEIMLPERNYHDYQELHQSNYNKKHKAACYQNEVRR